MTPEILASLTSIGPVGVVLVLILTGKLHTQATLDAEKRGRERAEKQVDDVLPMLDRLAEAIRESRRVP